MWNELEIELRLCNKCINPIIGQGNKDAEILFVMDEISEEENKQKQLLVDKYGEYFKKFLAYSNLDLSRCYFTTLLKCRIENRLPEKQDYDYWKEYLIMQIAIINPKYIITVGENVTKYLLNKQEDIFNLFGNIYDYYGIKVIPLLDKNYLIKAKESEKWKIIRIFEKLKDDIN